MNQSRVPETLKKSWIKFLLSCFIFLLSFNYITDQLRFGQIFPLNYFQSDQYAIQVVQFLDSFYITQIQLQKLQIPLEEIEVTKQEILDAKFNSYQYEQYLYDDNTGEHYSINTLTDEQIRDMIQYDKYQQYQSEVSHYKNTYYDQQDAFYYDITDSNGNHYTNVVLEEKDYLNIIEIPYKGKNVSNFSIVNSSARDKGISGTLYLPKYPMGESTIQGAFIQNITTKVIWIGAILAAIILVIPIYRNFKKIKNTQLNIPPQYKWIEDKYLDLPIEFKGLIFLVTVYILQNMNLTTYYRYYGNLLSYGFKLILQVIILLSILYFFFLQLKGIIHRIKNPELFKQEWYKGFYMSNIDDWSKLPIYRNTFIRITVYSCIIGVWGIIWGFCFHDYGAFLVITFISVILALILLSIIKKRTKAIQAIADTLSKMANNEITSEIYVKGNGLIANIAKDVNAVREGFAISNQKQSNSERLKTELITNVSHDLRTPLTSVLNYVDLAKRSDITEEERQEYLQIIDNKSKRLKVLIDDLFEASKMASGAVELNKEQVDLVALMYQALAEYEDRFEDQKLIVRTKTSNQHMYAYCDGRKMYRVFENLFSNVIKYTQPATRVYLEMTYEGSEIIITLKNISNYELGFDVSELAERFKRGDSSRHTEGSGLGLSIVKSILELHGAAFELSQDGDLFKVIIKINTL
ncbi:HAMP domain-containing histidine kinase [Turicibacter sp. MMM721]|uniref:histidine kinase n=2 Tax=Turicibacter bilis TaxID=2735723 RepID=A0ABY5JKN1_9FIRM|nr:HAMP domain-containing histidine kinase [Turicibacter bilis]UUF07276.1 HAMP domain-containing histidine kinase [Turicibacter bilis]